MLAAALGIPLLDDTDKSCAKACDLSFYSLGLRCSTIFLINSWEKCQKGPSQIKLIPGLSSLAITSETLVTDLAAFAPAHLPLMRYNFFIFI